MRRLLAPLALATTLTLVGCSSTDGDVDKDPPAGTNAQEETSAAEDAAESEEPAEEETPEAAQPVFGDSYTWDDGLTITISKPKPYKLSNSGFAGKGKHISFEVTLVNNTGATFDPALSSTTMQSGNAEAEEIFDSENGLNGSPSTKLLDGREAKWTIGYSVQDPADLVLEVSPDFERESVLYTS